MSTDTRIDRSPSLLSLNPSEIFDDEAEYRHLCRLFEKQFGEGVFGPSKKTVTFDSKRSARRMTHLNPFRKAGYTEVYQNKNGIKLTMDVHQFKLSELNIKVVDQCIVIEGKHKDRRDYHGFISRNFTRKFFLPKAMDPNTLSAKLSLDGLLTVTALSNVLPAPHARVIDICCTKKRALIPNTATKGPNKETKGPAKPAAKPSQRVKVNKTAKPKPKAQPQRSGNAKPQESGNAKPHESGNAKPQPPKESGKAQ